jgi:hypothetical protein
VLLTHSQFHLIGEESLGVALVADEEVGEVLAHPFLWRKGNEPPAEEVVDLLPLVGLSDADGIGGKVELMHLDCKGSDYWLLGRRGDG